MKFLNGTKKRVLTLSADNLRVIKWYVDAAFAVHPDFKSHTGAAMMFGRGAVINISRKQKLNTKSSTNSKLIGADDVSVMILWTKLFMEHQGYNIEKNILFQDNKSAILLETNGRKSAGKRSRALNICYFFSLIKLRKAIYPLSIVLLMRCGAISRASHCKARSFVALERKSWGRNSFACELLFQVFKMESELTAPIGVAICWCWWFVQWWIVEWCCFYLFRQE